MFHASLRRKDYRPLLLICCSEGFAREFLCYSVITVFDKNTLSEDIRRLGIILVAGGLVSGFLEDGDTLVATGFSLAGLIGLLIGNLAKLRNGQ